MLELVSPTAMGLAQQGTHSHHFAETLIEETSH